MFDLVKHGRDARKLLHLPGRFESRTISVRCINEFDTKCDQPSGRPNTKFQDWPIIDFDLSVYLVFRIVLVVLQCDP